MRLFGFSPTRATRPMWTIAELSLEAEFVTDGVFQHPQLKEYHPLGRIPALDVDGRGLFESAAICNYLADSRPEQGLSHPSGTWERARQDQWSFFALTEMEAWGWSTFRSMNIVTEDERVPAMYEYNRNAYRASAEALELELQNCEFLVNDSFSVADIIVGWTCHFGQTLGYNDEFDNIQDYLVRLMAREHCALPDLVESAA